MINSKAVSKILVRVPGPDRRFPGSVYKVVPRGYKPGQSDCGDHQDQACTLDRLADGSTLEGQMLNDTPGWPFARPAERLAASLSVNSGDIVLLANVVDEFQFGEALRAQHGTLTSRDALVPVAFAYPRASGPKDTTMAPLLQLLQGSGTLTDPTETKALIQFLIK